MAKVFLGVGHGGSDPGAVANGFKEKDLNLAIALACEDELVRHGVTVMMSRTRDENDTLPEEIKECNAFSPDLAVDIHNNAGGGDGAEAFYHYKGGVSKTLADNILAEIVKIGQNSRGAKTKLNSAGSDYFGFIRETVAPAVIVECAFVDNRTDMQIIDTDAELKVMGVALAKGILKTLGIAYKDETPVVTTKPSPKPTPAPAAPAKKSVDELAKEVIQGKWGNGSDRKNRLTTAGYNYGEVQARVDALLSGKTSSAPAKKSVDTLAKEVIRGDWGNGATRKKKLTAAGYDYAAVQKRVNELLK